MNQKFEELQSLDKNIAQTKKVPERKSATAMKAEIKKKRDATHTEKARKQNEKRSQSHAK
jgi:hypothetical protein